MKRKKRPNPMARELRTSGRYAPRIVRSKKAYTRKDKHKKGFDIKNSEPFL